MMACSWSREEARLQKLMQECLEEDDEEPKSDSDNQEDDGEEDNLERQDLDSDTEQETSETEATDEVARGNYPVFIGKDGTEWAKHMTKRNVKTRAENLIKHLPGTKY
ncbi:uncharacterized protein LOC126750492 isoform X2 [Anthonomus grandis grandis]|uniref:uncharacterized protein LOC126750492 isoform X2 n=1 Tax=Anthonomus grandis grandis TaxID=2921223 RepID=UPI0021655826|nr:uncharacterized protein LOC126750492 isoform X2 [Anthonomus grandis grandis]